MQSLLAQSRRFNRYDFRGPPSAPRKSRGCACILWALLSNAQIAHELDLNEADVQPLTRQLFSGIAAKGRRNRLKSACRRGTLAKEKPLILGKIQHGVPMIIKILKNVRQATILPPLFKTQ
ncbi:MAG: hypothetical protein M8364_05790 [Methylobacter sp.]|uniref:hypothetical protein n=1 Tax=Methylobacter sp. TaxID=2051955 RepID=UPI00258D70FF|nr:hypothetical protein [Methylobacter sp.]MCL7420397.1 hypothetical protein [Methylobacter sp.]